MGFAELLLLLTLPAGPADRGHAFVPDTTEPQLVALLQLRREDLPHALRGEIYPVAIVEGDSFRDVRVGGVHPLTGEVDRRLPETATPLESIREFTVYHDAAPVGRFRVNGIESAVYSCSAVRVGVGEMDLPDRFVRFGRLDPRVQTFAVSGIGVAYEYTLNYYLALGRPVSQADFTWDSLSDPAAMGRLRDAVWEAGGRALEGGGAHSGGALRWRDGFRTFDVDRDGRPEAVGIVEAVMPITSASGAAPPALSAIVWAGDRGADDPPKILAILEQTEGSGQEDVRRHLAEVIDLTGDGVAELFYQIDGWEHHAFEIHALRGDALEAVFAGADYGC